METVPDNYNTLFEMLVNEKSADSFTVKNRVVI